LGIKLRNRPIQAIDTSPHTLTAGWIAPLQAQAINEKSVLVKERFVLKKLKISAHVLELVK
jgi:hypothetical protein